MRKGKFINTSILLACLSAGKTKYGLQETHNLFSQAVKEEPGMKAAGMITVLPEFCKPANEMTSRNDAA